MMKLIFATILALGSIPFSVMAETASKAARTTPTVTCELLALGKVDGADRPATKVIAAATETFDASKSTTLRATSNSGLTEFAVILSPNSTNISIMEPGFKILAGTFTHAVVSVSPDIFLQLNAVNTPDGSLVLNCFGTR